MNVKSLLLAHLTKSQKGNAQQKAGDTSIEVPNTALMTLSVPDLFFFFNSVPQTGVERHSFIQTDARQFAATVNAKLCQVGSGLWEFEWQHWVRPQGAVTDLTSVVALQLVLIDGINPTVNLTRFANSNTHPQRLNGRFKALLSAEQELAWHIDVIGGAGTGTNTSEVSIIGNKLL